MKLLRALALSLLACAPVLAQTSAALLPTPKFQALDANGYPLAGGFVYTYAAGTTTLLASYTSSSGTVANTNPVVLDSSGSASIWLASNTPYKIVVQDANHVQLYSTDNVQAITNTSSTAAAITFTPAGMGGQSRTIQTVLSDVVNAAGYDTISNAFAAACGATPTRSVVIPGGISAATSYANTCGAFTLDYRVGTTALPTTGRTFTTPTFGGTFYDASPRTTNTLAQGDGSYAPILSLRVFETGAANVAPLYTEYHAGAGATGGAYGISSNVSADPGSNPAVVANNPNIQDASHVWLAGCSRTSGVGTCNTYTGTGSVPLFLTNNDGSHQCFYINGASDATFNGQFCPTTVTSTSVTFSSPGSNATGVTGGWLSPSHQFFGMELNINSASHDPGHILPSGSQALPVWGYVAAPTPFTWTNPTGGPGMANAPISAGFAALGGGDPAAPGSQYTGFIASDAIDDIFTAGWPQSGGRVSTAKSAFRARPIAPAVSGTNYRSQYSCWDSSVWNGSANYNEFSYCGGFVPLSNAANTDAAFQWFQQGYPSIYFYKDARISVQSGSSSALAYGFNGYSNGFYNNAGITTHVGSMANTGTFSSAAYSAGGTAGGTATVNVRNAANTAACTITYQAGLFISTTCP